MIDNNLDTIKEELRRTQEDLNDIASYLDDFLFFLPIAVSDVSPIGIVIHINKSFENISGFSALDLIGEHLADIFVEKAKINETLELTRKKGIVENQEFTLLTKDKNEVIVNAFFSARKDKEGNLTGCFLGIVDISAFKKLQYEVEAKVEERTKELQKKMEELERFNKIIIGRELKMIELKKEIKELKDQLEKKSKNT